MSERIAINPDVILWAVNRSGNNVDSYIARHSDVAGWIDGNKQPTIKQLETFSKSMHVPFGYLFLDTPPEEHMPIPMFRGTAGEGWFDINVYDTINNLKRRQEWLEEYVEANDIGRPDWIGIFNLKTPISIVVDKIRNILNLPEDWAFTVGTQDEAVNALADAMEEANVVVEFNGVVGNSSKRVIPVSECRGFCLVSNTAPFIFINNKDSKTAQMFTLVHEFAHLLIGVSAGFGGEIDAIHDVTERYCNMIAANFLMPLDLLCKRWVGIARTAKFFKVSRIAMARRAHDCKIITDDEYKTFCAEYFANAAVVKTPSSSGGNFYFIAIKRIGKNFAVHVNNALNDNQLSHIEAYRLTGLYGSTFTNTMKRLSL